MLKEYAVDPSLAGDFNNLRLLAALFDYSNPRRISRFPKKWERLVCDEAGHISDLNKTKVVEKLRQLKESKSCLYGFGRNYSPDKSWIDNATVENGTKPFHALVTDQEIDNSLSADEIDESHHLLRCSADHVISRSTNELSDLLESTLEQTKEVIFIDPYIQFYTNPSARRYKAFFKKIIEASRAGPNERNLSFIFCFSDQNVPANKSVADIESDICSFFNLTNPCVTVRIFTHSDMHNRYILTDIASFSLGDSLWSDSTQTREDHIRMMSRESYLELRKKYLINNIT